MTAQPSAASTAQLAHMGTYESIAEIELAFRPVMHAIAAAGGDCCEVVLHDLSDPEPDLGNTIVAIENGHVTGRRVGGPSSSLGAQVMHNQGADHNAYGYRGITSDGRELQCSSIYFRNPEGRIIAALCINYDISALLHSKRLLESFVPSTHEESAQEPNEIIGSDLVAVMEAMIGQAIREVGKPVERMNREERISVLSKLDSQGVLQMRKAVETVATRLGISRVTAYSYLDEAHSKTGGAA